MDTTYYEIIPDDRYRAYIQKFWVLNNQHSPLYTPVKYVLPNGCCTVAFISGNGIELNFTDKTLLMPAGVYLCGQLTKRTSLSLQPYSKAIMAQVKPWTPQMLTPASMTAFVDTPVNFNLIDAEKHKMYNDIDLSNDKCVIETFYNTLNKSLQKHSDSYFVHWLFGKLQAGVHGQKTIAEITAASGYTQRRIEQKLKTKVGLTAKEIQRILQLRQLVNNLSKPDYSGNLGSLSYLHGYYDQSHFIRSYQHIMQEKPSKFKVEQHILPVNGHFDYLQF